MTAYFFSLFINLAMRGRHGWYSLPMVISLSIQRLSWNN